MTEGDWVDVDEAVEDAAVMEGATDRGDPPGQRAPLDHDLDDDSAAEIVEDAHQAGD